MPPLRYVGVQRNSENTKILFGGDSFGQISQLGWSKFDQQKFREGEKRQSRFAWEEE